MIARFLLGAHVAVIAFATLAMVTILAGTMPAWTNSDITPRVFEFGWRYTGQVYIVLGLLAAVAHAGPRFGWTRSLAAFSLASAIALSSELLGTNFGVPFGPYHYTEMLGYRIAGDVPYPIPISWSYMLYCCLALCTRLVAADDSGRGRWRWAALAGVFLVAWDIPLEVHMTNVPPAHWVWDFGEMPAWMPGWLAADVFYGMPLTNWIGWFVTGTLIARVLLWIAPPSRWTAALSTSAFPLVLYAANGLMPVAVTARHGLWGGSVLGALAMGLPLVLALSRRRSDARAAASVAA